MALIIDGIMRGKLPWGLVILGALIAGLMHLSFVPALAFAVGVYLPLSTSMPIFVGGMVRVAVDRIKKTRAEDSDSSPAVLLSSGYIAGGAIAGILIALLALALGRASRTRSTSPDAFRPRGTTAPGRRSGPSGSWSPCSCSAAWASSSRGPTRRPSRKA